LADATRGGAFAPAGACDSAWLPPTPCHPARSRRIHASRATPSTGSARMAAQPALRAVRRRPAAIHPSVRVGLHGAR